MSASIGLVIGVGNAYRGDDAVGHVVARRLARLDLEGVEVVAHGGEAADLVERLSGAEFAILVDAAGPARGAGTVHRFDAAAAPLPAALFAASTHGFGVPEAIELARALGRLPARCVVFAVEGRSFEHGAALSPETEAAAETVARRVRDEIRGLVRGRGSSTSASGADSSFERDEPCTKQD